MKKGIKIACISLASLVGLVLIVVGVLVWVVFTPSRLTPIVRSVADKMIMCDHSIGEVELTFFSTFPQFSLAVDSVVLVNDIDGAPCDTLLRADCLRAEVNLRKLWQEGVVDVNGLLLEGAEVCLYTDSVGRCNYDVFVTDSVSEEDTTAFSLPFEGVNLQQVSLRRAWISYVDEQNDVHAELADGSVDLNVTLQGDVVGGSVRLNVPSVKASMDGVVYANDVSLVCDLPFESRLDSVRLTLQNASLAVNQFGLRVDGSVSLPENGDIQTDVHAELSDWDIQEVLRLVPDSFAYLLSDLRVDSGRVSVSADVQGIFNDSVYPLVSAHLQLADGGFAYRALPESLHGVQLDVSAYVNLNDSTDSYADVHRAEACVKSTSVELSGRVERLLADVEGDVSLWADVTLSDVQAFLPEDMRVQLAGRCSGDVQAHFVLDDILKGDFDDVKATGDLLAAQLVADYEGWHVETSEGKLQLQLPCKENKSEMSFASVGVDLANLKVTQGDSVAVDGAGVGLALSLSNPFKEDWLHAGCELKSTALSALYGGIYGDLQDADIAATLRLNKKDTTDVPQIQAQLFMEGLSGGMDSMQLVLERPRANVSMRPSKNNAKEPIISVTYGGEALSFAMGDDVSVEADSLSLTARTRHRSGAENVLLEWNPRVSVNLKDGLVKIADFKEDISIPAIQFDYSNRDFAIQESRIRLGNSDFQLKGDIKDIHKFVSGQGLLTGELEFVSQTTDVNQLMDLVSGLGSSAEELVEEDNVAVEETDSVQESMPFIVPKGVDLTLHTRIERALVGEQVATNLGGNLYVKDGVLILEEMGFICDAARLQLTAMYKSPRPNHLYVGLDYHMTDIQIEELIKMIPQVDSVLPMLRSFRGKGEFHLAAETNLNRDYAVKWSTLRGAASVQGKDLVLLDGETFSQIAKLMLFKKKTENKIDSISAEATVFRNEVDIFPFMVSMDKYKVALGGRHNLDMTFNYHLSLLSPLRIGVDVSGNFDDLKIKPTRCKYAEDFRPAERKVVETQNMTFRELIRQSLVSTLKKEE